MGMKQIVKLFTKKRPELVAKPEMGVFWFHVSVAVRCADCDAISSAIHSCPACGSRVLYSVESNMDGEKSAVAENLTFHQRIYG